MSEIGLSSSTSSPLAKLPVWAQVVAWVGLPSALCVFLVWSIVGDIKVQAKQQTADIAAIKNYMAQQADVAWQLVGINSRVCLNTSKTDSDRIACVSVPRRTDK